VQLGPANEGAMDKFKIPTVIKRTTNFFKRGDPFLPPILSTIVLECALLETPTVDVDIELLSACHEHELGSQFRE
jgi:hypothetical protein